MTRNNLRLWIHVTLLAAGSVLLFLGGPGYDSSRSFKHFWDIGHIVYFALLADLLARQRVINQMPVAGHWTAILVITLIAGVSIEFLQYGTARTPDIGDVLRDLTGSLLVLVFGAGGSALKPVIWRRSLQFAVLALLLVQLAPLARSLIDEAIAIRQFPLLSDFDTPFEIDRWGGSAGLSVVSMPTISESKLLRLSLTTARYSGTALDYFDGNWSSAQSLQIRLYNPDTNPLQITCRIHDLKHTDGTQEYEDRFNRSFLLAPGWTRLEIDLKDVEQSPAGRRMDMSRISGLGIFVISLPENRLLYLDTVRLSP